MSDSLIKTSDNLVPGLGKTIKKSNKILSDYFTDRSFVTKIASKDIGSEKVFRSLIENGDTSKIQAIKNIISPEDFNKMKGAFIDSIIKRNSDDFISFKRLDTVLNRKKDVVSILFDPQELVDIKEVVRLGERMDIPVLPSTGVGASNKFSFVKDAVTSAASNRIVIDKLKARARAAGIPKKVISKSLDNGTVGINDLIKAINRRGPRETIGIKIPQVTAAQKQER